MSEIQKSSKIFSTTIHLGPQEENKFIRLVFERLRAVAQVLAQRLVLALVLTLTDSSGGM